MPAQPYLLASVYRVYGLLVSAYFSTGSPHRASFSSSKDFWHAEVHLNFASFFVKVVSGLDMSANLGTNFL